MCSLVDADKLSASSGKLVECYQDRCSRELQDYVTQSNPSDSNRSMQLCLRLATLRLLSPTIVEELFFAGLIGSVEINSIIPYIMRLDAVEYGALLRGGGIAVTTSASATNDSSSPTYSAYLQFASTPADESLPATFGGEAQTEVCIDSRDADESKLEMA